MTNLQLLSRHHEIDDIYTHVFANNGFTWTAGQYMAFVIPEVSQHLEQYEHWFTISSAPCQGSINITVRASQSPFKQALMAMAPGQSIQTHTVDGDFAWPEAGSKPPVFVAGGIGITPFISMLRQRVHEGGELEATLLYFTRPNSGIAFQAEIEAMRQEHPLLKVHYSTDKPLQAEIVLNTLVDVEDVPVFLAGPVPMVDRIGKELEQNGMDVKRDWYFGYDIRNY